MSLDELARASTRELLAATASPDARRRAALDHKRRTRSVRKYAALVSLAAMVAAGWLILTGPTTEPDAVPADDAPSLNHDREGSAVSPDGDQLAFTDADGIHVVDRNGGGSTLVWPATRDQVPILGKPPSWSPDSSRLAFLRGVPVPDSSAPPGIANLALTLMLADLGSGEVTELHAVGTCFCVGIPYPRVEWSPDGSLIEVGTIRNGRNNGGARTGPVHTIRPDGSGWRPGSVDMTEP